jgi:hypothetical protein
MTFDDPHNDGGVTMAELKAADCKAHWRLTLVGMFAPPARCRDQVLSKMGTESVRVHARGMTSLRFGNRAGTGARANVRPHEAAYAIFLEVSYIS